MDTFKFIKEINSKGITIDIVDNNLHISASKGVLNEEILNDIKKHKEAILAMHQASIDNTEVKESYALTPAQERFWVLSKFEGGNTAYTINSLLEFNGKLRIDLLTKAFNIIIERHESLRTFFKEDKNNEVRQHIIPFSEINFNINTYNISDVKDVESEKAQILTTEINTPFELTEGPLLRASLLKVSKETHILSFSMHHIISDGWSMEILIKEITYVYSCLLNNAAIDLQPLTIQYKDYTDWIHKKITDLKDEESFWLHKFSGELPIINIPTSQKRPIKKTFNGKSIVDFFSVETTKKIKSFSKENATTLFTTLMAGINGLLYRYTNQNDIIIGIPSSGREHPDLKNQIGLYINTLAIRTKFEKDITFNQLLKIQEKELFDAYSNQNYPFDRLVNKINVDRDTSRSPLFDIMAVIHNQETVMDTTKTEDTSVNSYDTIDSKVSKFDLTFSFIEQEDTLLLDIEYNTDIFKESVIHNLMNHLEMFLTAAINEPEKELGAIVFISENEKNLLLHEYNNSTVAYPKDETVVSLFEKQSKATPNEIAFVFNLKTPYSNSLEKSFTPINVSYNELNIRANQFSDFLLSKYKIKKNELVGILLEKSEWLIPVLLGTLKIGAAYVPIDPNYPEEKVQYLTSFTNCRITINDAILEDFITTTGNYKKSNPAIEITPDQLVHVMFTSGSTGMPKGVMLTHKNIVGFSKPCSYMELNSNTTILSTVSVAFDTTNMEFWAALLNQSKIILVKKNDLLSPQVFKHIVRSNKVNTMFLTSSWFENLIDTDISIFEGITQFLSGGDIESVRHFNLLRSQYPDMQIIHGYGPCEDTTFSTTYKVTKTHLDRIPIGKPMDNSRSYILNEYMQLQPVGIPGILYLGGIGVSKGYYKNEELTNQRFIKNPLNKEETLYNTGDYAKWTEEGDIIFIGRIDRQVKIRGKIIDTKDIENTLTKQDQINQSVVEVKVLKNEKRIIAYVAVNESFDVKKIKETLKKELPIHMIPEIFIEIPALPLTRNGKTDKTKLPIVTEEHLNNANEYIAPKTKTQKVLANIWGSVLAIEKVGISTNFFDLGGHSLLAVRVISLVRKDLKTELVIDDIFEHPTIEELSKCIDAKEEGVLLPQIVSEKRPENIPLSFSQERLWFIDKLQGSINYHIPIILKLNGTYNEADLENSFKKIMQRHEVLRTLFYEQEGAVYQKVESQEHWKLKTITTQNQNLSDVIDEEIWTAFDLSSDYPLRATLLKKAANENILIIVGHHIAFDGWSMPIFVNELVLNYESIIKNEEASLPKLPVQYVDYAIWQKKYINGNILANEIEYWKDKLSALSFLNFPSDFPRPSTQSLQGESIDHSIASDLTKKINAVSKKEGVTPFITLLTAYNILLYKYSGQPDICVGSPVANRDQVEIEPLIGFFLNTLPLRNYVDGDLSFKALLSEVKTTTLRAIAHQKVPFEQIVQKVVKNRDLTKTPLFQTVFILQNNVQAELKEVNELQIDTLSFNQKTTKYDITLSVTETNGEMLIEATYNTDLFKRETIKQLLENYELLLASIVDNVDEKIDSISISSLNKDKLSIPKKYPYQVPTQETILEAIKEKTLKHPSKQALVYQTESLSYHQLDLKSNQIANYISKQGVKENDIVAISLDNPLEMMLTIIGILKSGAAYLPLDRRYPEERTNFIIQNSDVKLIIADKNIKLSEKTESVKCVSLKKIEATSKYDDQELNVTISRKSLAYVIYTSGSTGTPKGVKISHENLVDYFQGFFLNTTTKNCETFGLLSTFAGDLSYTIVYGALVSGGTLHLFSYDDLLNPIAIHNYLSKNSIDCIKMTPSHWKSLETDKPLIPKKLIIFGGEELTGNEIDKIKSQTTQVAIINHYGPSETTIGKTLYLVDINKTYHKVPIGKPFTNSDIYILDKSNNNAGIGMPGELNIGGYGVSSGYLNNIEQSKEKFVPSPFDKNKILYKTGDLARYLPDGNIEFVGRVDHQIKIRGNRVELKEIEAVLLQSDFVDEVFLDVKKDQNATPQIVAYIVPNEGFAKNLIYTYLKSKLPDYMIPSFICEIPAIPLTPNGKINRQKLPLPLKKETAENIKTAPRDITETHVMNIWTEILGNQHIGIHQNFFEIGGHSLLAMQLISAIKLKFNCEIQVKDIFYLPTIAELSSKIKTLNKSTLSPIKKYERPDFIPLSFTQKRLWFLDKVAGSINYHIPIIIRLKGKVDKLLLEKSINAILNRHEVLRTVYKDKDGLPYQKVLEKDTWKLAHTRLSNSSSSMTELIQNQVNTPFKLAEEHPLRGLLIHTPSDEYVLSIIIHHIAFDGWSRSIFINELVQIFNTLKKGEQLNFEALPIQYADFSIWENEQFENGKLAERLEYWKRKLESAASLDLFLDYPRGETQSQKGKLYQFYLDETLSEKLEEQAKKHDASLFMLLIAIFKILLYKYSGQTDISIGTAIANRTAKEVEPLIGFFANTIVLRNNLDLNIPFAEFLKNVKETTLEAYENQDVPFEKIVSEVADKQVTNRNPLFDVGFTLQNNPVAKNTELTDLSLLEEDYEHDSAKVDLTVGVIRVGKELNVDFEYCSDLFNEETIKKMANHFKALLSIFTADPNKLIGNSSILEASDKNEILSRYNTLEINLDKNETILDIFRNQAKLNPNQAAIIVLDKQLITYKELDEKSNQFAHYLAHKGVKKGDMIPLLLENSFSMMVGIIGILKLGAVYIPLSISNSKHLTVAILENANSNLVISETKFDDLFEQNAAYKIIFIDSDAEKLSTFPIANTSVSILPEDASHIMYNWKKGKPHGVISTHKALYSLLNTMHDNYPLESSDRMLLKGDPAVDTTVYELFGWILPGSSLVIPASQKDLDVPSFLNLVRDTNITHLHVSTWYLSFLMSYLRTIIEDSHLSKLKHVVLSDTNLAPDFIKLYKQLGLKAKLISLYGHTETLMHSSHNLHDFSNESVKSNSIGKPFQGNNFYILDSNLALVPDGTVGYLYTSGTQLTDGYLNNSEFTSEKFITNPYGDENHKLLYKTGDLARWSASDAIELVGREDLKVKYRDYRIDLDDIAFALKNHNSIADASVFIKKDEKNSDSLMACILAKETFDEESIKSYLNDIMPAYMIPTSFVEVEEFPMDTNGNVHRKVLQQRVNNYVLNKEYIAPSTTLEKTLVAIWEELLEVEQVGITDDFFDLGGRSLLVISVISKIEEKLNIQLPFLTLFNYTTIKSLANYIQLSSSEPEDAESEYEILDI
ncbi:amino acid adenylation domain-containing protein [Kordia sp. YSTF-M3]|uniref:Amino acid adenylation domain-containing protein n=1 Tax=Kordia aestuariivivens TaxID=2759037 RepID=A0ABR7QE71_9FLAO|nr:non-ribosomal peptide synthetase [Kordia aestuariivivens]MBC8756870.1 amino acid adenylation domain-containing protein [Kordia aestuariivivens]